MTYPDTIKLATVSPDGYGDKTATALAEVKANFIKRSGITHGNNIDGETSDAAVYLQPTDANVLSNLDNLEGMYVIVEPFSSSNWYRISSANVAQRKLLDNALDNVYCRLEKIAGLAYVSVS